MRCGVGTAAVSVSRDTNHFLIFMPAAAEILSGVDGKLETTLSDVHGNCGSGSFSPDGKKVVAICGEKIAQIWDTATGASLGTFTRKDEIILSASFSTLGARVITALENGIASVWDAESGRLLARFGGGERPIAGATFSPDANQVLTLSDGNPAQVWDISTVVAITTFPGEGAAAFSPDGSRVATETDQKVRIWDAHTGALVTFLTLAWDPLKSPPMELEVIGPTLLAFSPDRTQLAIGSGDGNVQLWNIIDNPQLLSILILPTRRSSLAAVGFWLRAQKIQARYGIHITTHLCCKSRDRPRRLAATVSR